jgi:hypothetical protein
MRCKITRLKDVRLAVRNSIHAESEANEAYTRVENLRFLYPRPEPFTRSQQFASYMENAAEDWPECVGTSFWIGCVGRWIDHGLESEDEMFAEARQELQRLREARA